MGIGAPVHFLTATPQERKSNSAYQAIVKTGGIGTVSEKDFGEYVARLREHHVPSAHGAVKSSHAQLPVSSAGDEGTDGGYESGVLARMFDERERSNVPPAPPPDAGHHLQYGELTPEEQIVPLRAPQAHHYMSSSPVYDVVEVDNLGAPPPDPFGYEPALDDPVQGDQQPPVVATGPNQGEELMRGGAVGGGGGMLVMRRWAQDTHLAFK